MLSSEGKFLPYCAGTARSLIKEVPNKNCKKALDDFLRKLPVQSNARQETVGHSHAELQIPLPQY